ncbi:universal stress protein [Streptomyces lydicus]|uniref:universal stress protein n=1 Tax=Streptomyces lydicus TaxID=47763 RepID=UPI0028709D44|nr:universal stress protein [Streptomyces lydicus]
MERPLVVGVDGSEPSLRAVDWAADEAALRRVPLRVVYASLWERYEGVAPAEDLGKPSDQVRAEDVVAAAARRAQGRHAHLKIATDVLPEEPEYALVRESRTSCALVMGTRGRSGIADMLLGSVSLTVAAHADCPVIVLRGSHANQAAAGTHCRIAVGVGEHPEHSAAVRFALEEARRRRVPVEAVHAWRRPAPGTGRPLPSAESARLPGQRAAEALAEALAVAPADVEVRPRTVEGHARKALLDASHGADLLVVGAQRREDRFGLQLGRVAHTVLHHSACPVAVVPQRV